MKEKSGFTLVELIVAMAIIAILIVLGIIGFSVARRSARNTQRRDVASELLLYKEDFETKHRTAPSNADVEITSSDCTLEYSDGVNTEDYELSSCSGFDTADNVGNGNCSDNLSKNELDFIYAGDGETIGVCLEPNGEHMVVGDYSEGGSI